MRLAVCLLAFTCFAAVVRGQVSNCAAVGGNCTGWTYADDLFIGNATLYNGWGLPYVRDATTPNIRGVHSASITTAAIILHGLQRDATAYYCYFKYALTEAGRLENTYFIAPRFMLAADNPGANQFYWVSNTAWMEGGRSNQGTSRIASFQILDDILKVFNNKTAYPGLTQILIVGHSAGAQMAHRYAVTTGIEKLLSVPIRYVVENAGSYTYLDTKRAILPPVNIPDCYACNATDILSEGKTYSFLPATTGQQQNCTGYNTYKFGLDGANVYVTQRNVSTIRSEYGLKDVTYLLGTDDTCNDILGPPATCGCDDSSLDTDCDAQMQGYCRLQRGVIYYQYIQQFYGKQTHKVAYVQGLAHNGCLMLTSTSSLTSMFPDYVPTTAATTTTTTTTTTTAATTDASTTASSSTTAAPTSSSGSTGSTGTVTGTTGTPATNVTYSVTVTFSGTCADFAAKANTIIAALKSALGIDIKVDNCEDGTKRAGATVKMTATAPSTANVNTDNLKAQVATAATDAGLTGVNVNVTQNSPSSTTTSSTGSIVTLSFVVFVLSLLFLL